MTEDDLLLGVTEALTLAGWRWTHIRRSDGITVGNIGLPDIIAVHPERRLVLAWELKGDHGILSIDQAAWIAAWANAERTDVRVVKPADYDAALTIILGGKVRGRHVEPDLA